MIIINRKKLATISLVICMFFNPMGFDMLFKAVMELTDSYWITDLIFYLISLLFLVLYFLLSNINPIKELKLKLKKNG
jgi:uncharacterized membrane protein